MSDLELLMAWMREQGKAVCVGNLFGTVVIGIYPPYLCEDRLYPRQAMVNIRHDRVDLFSASNPSPLLPCDTLDLSPEAILEAMTWVEMAG